jgi:hypothetical protein
MKKIIIVLLLFIGSFAQAQDTRTVTIRPTKSWLVDSLFAGRYNLSLFTDYGYKIFVNNSKKFQIDSSGIFNYFSGIHNFTNGSNVTFGTTDNYNLKFKTNDSTRIEISNRGNLILPTPIKGNKFGGIELFDGQNLLSLFVPSNGTDNSNFFFGRNSGNFTMSGVNAYNGSYNWGVGYNCLKNITTGYYNFMAGYGTGSLISTGASNFGMGNFTLGNLTSGVGNTALGNQSLNQVGGAMYWNIMIGANAGSGTSTSYTPYNNMGFGNNAFLRIRTAKHNIAMGGNVLNELLGGSSNIIIGHNTSNQYGTPFTIGTGHSLVDGNQNIWIGDTLNTSNPNENRKMNIANVFFAKEIYTDSVGFGIGYEVRNPNSTLQVDGSLSLSYLERTDNYTLTTSDYTVGMNVTAKDVILPSAIGKVGRIYVIKLLVSGETEIYPNGSETIDGDTKYTINTLNGSVMLQSTGTNWIVLSNY